MCKKNLRPGRATPEALAGVPGMGPTGAPGKWLAGVPGIEPGTLPRIETAAAGPVFIAAGTPGCIRSCCKLGSPKGKTLVAGEAEALAGSRESCATA